LIIWYGSDRRIVMYPCNNNELLNFVCIHPDTESHATKSDGEPYTLFDYLANAKTEAKS
jgi:hypothetical protein